MRKLGRYNYLEIDFDLNIHFSREHFYSGAGSYAGINAGDGDGDICCRIASVVGGSY